MTLAESTSSLQRDWTYAAHDLFAEVSKDRLEVGNFEQKIKALYQARSCALQTTNPGIDLLDRDIRILDAQIPNVCQQINESPHGSSHKIDILVMSTIFKNLIQTFNEDRTHYNYFYREIVPLKLKDYSYGKDPLVLDWFTIATLSVLSKEDQNRMRLTLVLPPAIQAKIMQFRTNLGKLVFTSFTKNDLAQLIALFEDDKLAVSEQIRAVWNGYQDMIASAKDETEDYSAKLRENLKMCLPLMLPKLPDILPTPEGKTPG